MFRKESRFADPASLLNNLTPEERVLLFDLVEQDVAREYEDREVAIRAEQEAALAAAAAEYEARLAAWSKDFGARLHDRSETGLNEIAKASANLAVQLAGKITRELVPLDPEILVRAMRTTLFKIPGGQQVRIAVHPEDAAWLEQHPELVRELQLESIESDRRIERGGCVLRSGVREWDATLSGQLESLGEIVREAIATSGSDPQPVAPEENDDPGLE